MQLEALGRRDKLGGANVLYLLLIFYALFAFNRIKILAMPKVDGFATSNLVVLCVVCIIAIAMLETKAGYRARNVNQKTLMALLCLFVVSVSLLLSTNIPQTVYGLLVMLVPLFFIISPPKQSESQFIRMLGFLNILALIYSVITVVSALNYSAIMELIGNDGRQYGDQARASLPIGSSISVSYYLNISLPISLYLFVRATSRKEKWYYIICVALNIAATVLQLSRASVLTMVTIVVFFLLFVRGEGSFVKKSAFVGVLAVVIFLLAWRTDISRLLDGFFADGGTSDEARFNAMYLGFHLFFNNFAVGTGVGEHFYRLWSGSNLLTVDGVSGLIDPHCAYALLFSECGLIGGLIYVALFVISTSKIRNIKDNLTRRTGYLIIAALLINSISGSHLINEISFSTIAFIYVALFIGRAEGELCEGDEV